MAKQANDAIRAYHIQTLKKFSTITVEITFVQEQEKSEMEARNLVAKVLPQVLAPFPTKIATKSYFANLYGARVYSGVQRRGDKHEATFQFLFTDPQLVHDEAYQLDDIMTCIRRVLLEPYLEDGGFASQVVDLERQLIEAKLTNMEDDKATYAQTQLLKHMFAGTPFAERAYGELARYRDITVADVYEAYKRMINEDTLVLSVVGDIDETAIKDGLTEMFKGTQEQSVALAAQRHIARGTKDVQSVTELQAVKQARLHIGYRVPTTIEAADYFVHKVAIEILGGGSQSKLFQNVRERASLAYSVNASMDNYAEALYIYAGVDRGQIAEAHAIIKQQIEAMQAGDITADELRLAKDNLLHRISMAQDNAFSVLQSMRQLTEFANVSTLEAWKAAFEAVTLEEVVNASKTWVEDTVFVLTSDEKTTEGSEQ